MESMIRENILTIPAGNSNIYLIKNGKESLLVDAGPPKKGKSILKRMRSYGFNPEDIALIVITHCHYDHVGSLEYLKQKSGAKVLVHENEAENLRYGYLALPDGTNTITRFLVWMGRTFFSSVGKYNPVEPDILISKRYELEIEGLDAFVIPTPGHTKGSVTLILENTVAFVGDAAFNIVGTGVYPPFANDPNKLMESWESLLQTHVKYIYPGHGKMFKIEKLSKSYGKRKRYNG